MEQPSFTSIPESGFLGLIKQLEQDAWAGVDVTAYLDDKLVVLKPLAQAPAVVVYKVTLLLTVGELARSRDGTYSAAGRDKVWDGKQGALVGGLLAAAGDDDAEKRAAAGRLKPLLTTGKSGLGQTQLTFQREVDFGRKQVEITSKGQPAADVALLGLQPAIDAIAKATQELADAIAHGDSDERPSDQVKRAKNACASACLWVANSLARLGENGLPSDRDLAEKLRETLSALAARYPAAPPKTAAAGASGATGATGATAATGPAGPTGPAKG